MALNAKTILEYVNKRGDEAAMRVFGVSRRRALAAFKPRKNRRPRKPARKDREEIVARQKKARP